MGEALDSEDVVASDIRKVSQALSMEEVVV